MPQQNKENKKRGKKVHADLDDVEYRRKRDKNNIAVKKSRDKTKQRTKETQIRLNQLRTKNETLEEKIKLLKEELEFLKTLFGLYAGRTDLNEYDKKNISALLQENEALSSKAAKELRNDPNFKLTKE
ncbi:UNVERIFIED_CONTAM: hypothetical protein PYX00_004851 [Menopon gallinae]|uniref:BZIP domain-containing protein n=1 Tax=Menopon gallinae TaxID=328185 RepID=A0AAW2I7K4_9NEOP